MWYYRIIVFVKNFINVRICRDFKLSNRSGVMPLWGILVSIKWNQWCLVYFPRISSTGKKYWFLEITIYILIACSGQHEARKMNCKRKGLNKYRAIWFSWSLIWGDGCWDIFVHLKAEYLSAQVRNGHFSVDLLTTCPWLTFLLG